MKTDPLIQGPLGSIVHTVESAVLSAAEYLEQAAANGIALQVNVKSDRTMVMNLDLESQRRILSVLPSS